MAYLIAAMVMTLSVLEGYTPIASLFKCNSSYLWCVAWFLCICRGSCKFLVPLKYISGTAKDKDLNFVFWLPT